MAFRVERQDLVRVIGGAGDAREVVREAVVAVEAVGKLDRKSVV